VLSGSKQQEAGQLTLSSIQMLSFFFHRRYDNAVSADPCIHQSMILLLNSVYVPASKGCSIQSKQVDVIHLQPLFTTGHALHSCLLLTSLDVFESQTRTA
jgi:hypothetical protein